MTQPARPTASSTTTAEGKVDQLVQRRFFPQTGVPGVFVDVGAAGPEYLSISAYYRALGWRVIAIEPNPQFYEMHRSRGYEAYPFACGDHDEDNVDFFVVDSHGAAYLSGEVSYESFSSLGIKDSYAALKTGLDKRIIKRNLRRLSTLLSNEIPNVRKVDILSIDVEGWELEVLSGLDVSRHRPSVIIVENLFKEKRYRVFLKHMGYTLWRRVYPNDIYVDWKFIRPGFYRLGFAIECLGNLLTSRGR